MSNITKNDLKTLSSSVNEAYNIIKHANGSNEERIEALKNLEIALDILNKKELKFASKKEAIQHLANISGKSIKIANEDKEYSDVVFLQRDDSFDDFTDEETKETGIDAFFGAGEDAMMDYLMQWEHGDSIPASDQEPWGRSDNTYEKNFGSDAYVMSYNSGLGYAGLSRVEDKIDD